MRATHHVAVTVFVAVPAADLTDAGHIAEVAVQQALRRAATPKTRADEDTFVIEADVRTGRAMVVVADTVETTRAALNGYLATRPTNKAFE